MRNSTLGSLVLFLLMLAIVSSGQEGAKVPAIDPATTAPSPAPDIAIEENAIRTDSLPTPAAVQEPISIPEAIKQDGQSSTPLTVSKSKKKNGLQIVKAECPPVSGKMSHELT